MFVIIIRPHAGAPFAHPYIPNVWVDARSVATELSRDFRDSLVTVRALAGEHVYLFRNGTQVR
jgi:hypothetical protein